MVIASVAISVVVIYAIAAYNNLVGKHNKVKNFWSQIDVQLKRRFDLAAQMFPANIIAGVFGFKQKAFFQVDEDEKKKLQVEF